MSEERKVTSNNFELIFTKDEDQWVERVANFGGFENVEFSIDLETQCFDEENWKNIPALIDFLDTHLKAFVEKSNEPLISFAIKSGYFAPEDFVCLEFGFLNWVQIIDNTYSASPNSWKFELEFSTNNNRNTIDNIDGYGRWTVTFSGKCISGIRRINW